MLPMVRQAHHENELAETFNLILSLSKDEAKISCFQSLLAPVHPRRFYILARLPCRNASAVSFGFMGASVRLDGNAAS